MKKPTQTTKYLLFGTTTILACAIGFYAGYSFNKSNDKPAVTTELISVTKEICSDSDESTASEFGCLVETLDKLAAEREWKMGKLSINQESFNTYELMDIPGSIKKIQMWSKDFEKNRDIECFASNATYYFGSGTPNAVVTCAIKYEERAIKTLNYIHDDVITEVGFGTSDPIPDFEPSESNILNLAKTNITSDRHCYWEEAECN